MPISVNSSRRMWRRRRKQLGAKPMRISYRTWTVIARAVRRDHSTIKL
jgi:hypothetical protein